MIAVTILGSNSAVPAYGRHPTSQLIQTRDQYFLIDCGEGTQLQMDTYKIKRSKINHIFISHLHGDHYFGLIGLLNTFGLNKRTTDLHVYSPPGLEKVVQMQLNLADARLPYPLHFHDITGNGVLFENEKIQVSTFEVNHRIACFGFLFSEKKYPFKLDIDQVRKYQIPKEFYENLHYGEDYFTATGEKILNKQLTIKAKPGKSYAYCADTAYFEKICPHIQGVDLMYHETTYLKELEEKAVARFHSTTLDAAKIASLAKAKRLLIGHFSSMYENLDLFREEVQSAFENSDLALEGTTYFA